MSKGKIPVSKAKTAYGLLSEIAALSLAEPKRMSMHVWRVTKWQVRRGDMDEPENGFPACGTVGCIGGWVDTLKPNRTGASHTLGIDSDQESELFYGRLCYQTNQQTPSHARAVVAHIREFQEKYKAQLLAKKV